MTVRTKVLETLQRRQRELVAGQTSRSRRLREAAQALEVLPVRCVWGRDYGIRLADAEVVSFNARPPHDPTVETDRRVRTIVLGFACGRHPELAPLVPPRPGDARECPQCGGSGRARGKGGERTCSGCGGLGWSVPPLGA